MKTNTIVTLAEKTITKRQAKKLAVSYSSFLNAVNDGDILGKLVYGRVLRNIQNEINLYLVDKDSLETTISRAYAHQWKGEAIEQGCIVED